MNTKPPLVVIAGPTASGKSALALALSRLTPATIINADASQVYRDLRVLSARPWEAEEAEAPHRLFGTVDGAAPCSAAAWAADAREAVAEAHRLGRLPVLVGGTGLYVRTLLHGIAPVPDIDGGVRAEVRALTVAEAYERLSVADPEAAARLSPNDTTRVARALEVMLSTGRTLSAWQTERSGGISDAMSVTGIVLLPEREGLFARCDARFMAMLDQGAVDEVRALLSRGLSPALPVMRAIGVREIAQFIADPAYRDAAISNAQIATRQYAKRQFTWFRNQSPPAWERFTTQLDADNVNDLAIKLRDMTLTS